MIFSPWRGGGQQSVGDCCKSRDSRKEHLFYRVPQKTDKILLVFTAAVGFLFLFRCVFCLVFLLLLPQDTEKGRNRLSKFVYQGRNKASQTLASEEVLITTEPKGSQIHASGWVGFKPSAKTESNVSRVSLCVLVGRRRLARCVCGVFLADLIAAENLRFFVFYLCLTYAV